MAAAAVPPPAPAPPVVPATSDPGPPQQPLTGLTSRESGDDVSVLQVSWVIELFHPECQTLFQAVQTGPLHGNICRNIVIAQMYT